MTPNEMGTDAAKWANEFVRIFGHRMAAIDEGDMIAWFANAIEETKRIERESASTEVDNPRAQVAALREAVERAHIKLSAYVGVCRGDTELTGTVLPLVSAVMNDTTAAAQAHDARVWNAAIDAAVSAYAAEMGRRAEVYGLSFDQKISGYVSIFESLKKERDQ